MGRGVESKEGNKLDLEEHSRRTGHACGRVHVYIYLDTARDYGLNIPDCFQLAPSAVARHCRLVRQVCEKTNTHTHTDSTDAFRYSSYLGEIKLGKELYIANEVLF